MTEEQEYVVEQSSVRIFHHFHPPFIPCGIMFGLRLIQVALHNFNVQYIMFLFACNASQWIIRIVLHCICEIEADRSQKDKIIYVSQVTEFHCEIIFDLRAWFPLLNRSCNVASSARCAPAASFWQNSCFV